MQLNQADSQGLCLYYSLWRRQRRAGVLSLRLWHQTLSLWWTSHFGGHQITEEDWKRESQCTTSCLMLLCDSEKRAGQMNGPREVTMGECFQLFRFYFEGGQGCCELRPVHTKNKVWLC